MPNATRSVRSILACLGVTIAVAVVPIGCDNPQNEAGTVKVEPRAGEVAAPDSRETLEGGER